MAAVYFYREGRQAEPEREGLTYEANIIQGDIPGKTKEERQRELDSIVEEGMLSMSINATPSGRTNGADRTINWLIENPSNQGKLIRVEISREDTGDIIYETGAIPPGNYVESAPLKADLPPGQYSCIAKFYAYKEDDETYLGQAAAQIKLVLYEDEEGEETGNEKTPHTAALCGAFAACVVYRRVGGGDEREVRPVCLLVI